MDLGPRLRQRDGVSCGPAAAVAAGVLLDPPYRRLVGGADDDWIAAEQRRVHARVNRLWPRALGTTPAAMVAAIDAHGGGVRYRWRLFRGLWGGRDSLADVLAAVGAGRPVAMLVGTVVPRHWVLIVAADARLRCYEPSSGRLRDLGPADVRAGRLTGVGYPRPFAFVLPR
ncbi:hypothetical protein [Mycolicibacterium sediminis]|uniref:Peptidase C39 n=1 Tax=Mycolicibacterium sediminis TaxID=1286180 RepID=A0A7I7QL85_9MYCO|nr:hypothetical protein [Mycolicibacterium sediminis]BBY26636.1 hypothetical protein MSEDJ_07320 [Mycolicibacterium sediminis]